MRQASFLLSKELLHQWMQLPYSACVLSMDTDPATGQMRVLVHDDNLPDAREPHRVEPTCRRVEWDWNLPIAPADSVDPNTTEPATLGPQGAGGGDAS